LNSKSGIHCKKSNKNGELLKELLFKNECMVLNLHCEPTFHIYKLNGKDDHHEFLDLFIGPPSIANKIKSYNVLKSDLLDGCQSQTFHSAVELEIEINQTKESQYITSKEGEYEYSKADWLSFQTNLLQFKINNAESFTCEDLAQIITEKILYEKNLNIPLKERTCKSQPPLPIQILKLINLRNKQQSKFKKTRSQIDQENYTLFAKQVREKIVEYKNETWQKFVSSFGPRPWSSEAYWREINFNKEHKDIKKVVIKNNHESRDDKDTANDFKAKLFKKFDENVKYSQSFNNEHKIFVEKYIDSNAYESLYKDKSIRFITSSEILMAIRKLKPKTKSDMHGISNLIIRKLPQNITQYLTVLFNKCLQENNLPSEWKSSRIVLLRKMSVKENKIDSRIPSLMRLFERIIYQRISAHLKSKNILIKEQSGFRRHRQAKDNLIFMTQKVLESLGKREKACCIFFDIETAFDSVWHKGLIFKLVKIGLPYYLVKFLQNYLKDRTFSIKVGNFTTSPEKIGCGLSQGMTLSPLLFSIYINDIPLLSGPPNEFSLLFGDKLVYIHLFKQIEKETEIMMNCQLKKLNNWMNLWRLKFSSQKCSYSIFSKNFKSGENGRKGYNNEKLNLLLDRMEIKLNNQHSFLGIRFDKHFTFKNQILQLRRTCIKRLNGIKIFTHKSRSLNKRQLITIYKILVRSLIDNSLFFYEILSTQLKRKLQSIQNSALRTIFKKKDDFDAGLLHKWAKIENIESRAIKLTKAYMVNCRLNKNPLYQFLISSFKSYCKVNPRIKTLLG
jgi:hypothetical protein